MRFNPPNSTSMAFRSQSEDSEDDTGSAFTADSIRSSSSPTSDTSTDTSSGGSADDRSDDSAEGRSERRLVDQRPEHKHFAFFKSCDGRAFNKRYGVFAQTKPLKGGLAIPGHHGLIPEFVSAEQYYQWRQAMVIARHNCPKKQGRALQDALEAVDDDYREAARQVVAQDLPRVVQLEEHRSYYACKRMVHLFILTAAAQQDWNTEQLEALYIGNFYKFRADAVALDTLVGTLFDDKEFIVKACGYD